jgi:hypothetical protein
MEFDLSKETIGASVYSPFPGLSHTSFEILEGAVFEVPEEQTLLLELPLWLEKSPLIHPLSFTSSIVLFLLPSDVAEDTELELDFKR